jgi:hypothetical protein
MNRVVLDHISTYKLNLIYCICVKKNKFIVLQSYFPQKLWTNDFDNNSAVPCTNNIQYMCTSRIKCKDITNNKFFHTVNVIKSKYL